MADALMAQSLAPQEQGQMVSGHYVGSSPLNGLAQMFKGYIAAKSMRDMPSQQAELASMQGRQLDSMLGMGQPSQGQANQAALMADGQGPTTQAAQSANQFAGGGQSPLVPAGADPRQVKNMVMWGGPQMLGELLKDNMKSTDTMKNAGWEGRSAAEMRDAARGKDAADAYIRPTLVSPGTTALDVNNRPVFNAPSSDGRVVNYAPNGTATMGVVPGAVASIGATVGAEAGAKNTSAAENATVTVNTPQGPRLMTQKQANEFAAGNGGAPASAIPRDQLIANLGEHFDIPQSVLSGTRTAGQQQALFNQRGQPGIYMPTNPADHPGQTSFHDNALDVPSEMSNNKLFQTYMKKNGWTRPNPGGDPVHWEPAKGASASPVAPQGSAPGVPLQDETQNDFGKSIGKIAAEQILKGQELAQGAAETIQGINEARQAVKSGAFQGSGADAKLAVVKFVNANIPGVTIDPSKAGNTDYLKSILGKGLLEQAKTLGSNPSNADANRINDIVGSIDKDPAAMDKILDWREKMARQSIERHNGKVDDAEKRGMKSPYDLRVNMPTTTNTDINALLQKYPGN